MVPVVAKQGGMMENSSEVTGLAQESEAAARPTPSERASAEAEERRRKRSAVDGSEIEIAGRGGLDPVRYGDWEIKGLTSDF